MTKTEAVNLWKKLEAVRDDERIEKIFGRKPLGPDEAPVFDVRLDAVSDHDETRSYRVRVTPATSQELELMRIKFIVDLVEEMGLQTSVDNSGIVID